MGRRLWWKRGKPGLLRFEFYLCGQVVLIGRLDSVTLLGARPKCPGTVRNRDSRLSIWELHAECWV